MDGVYELGDKDTGDVRGDMSFVLSKKGAGLEEVLDQILYATLARFQGDSENSTDLILEMQVEVDGQWGPYLQCNPADNNVPLGDWKCSLGTYVLEPDNFP